MYTGSAAVGSAERGLHRSAIHHAVADRLSSRFAGTPCLRRSSPWQKSRGRRLTSTSSVESRLWLGLFVVKTPRISFNARRFAACDTEAAEGDITHKLISRLRSSGFLAVCQSMKKLVCNQVKISILCAQLACRGGRGRWPGPLGRNTNACQVDAQGWICFGVLRG